MRIGFKAKKIYCEDNVVENGVLIVEDGTILGVKNDCSVNDCDELIDYSQYELIPGLIDPHIHGADGFDTMNCSYEALNSISMFLAKHGITGFLPTTVTQDINKVKNAVENVAENIHKVKGAEILGTYVEGPYITEEHRGAHATEFIREICVDELKELLEAGKGTVKTITIAPEKKNAIECIKFLRSKGVNVSMGHTSATYKETMDAINNGANIAVHTFNGMRNFNHREPGIIGAVLTEDSIFCEAICDLIHVHPAALNMIVRCKSKDKIVLISDCMEAAGLKDGNYELGALKVIVKDGVARTETGSLAGSITNILNCVKNMVESVGVSKEDAIKMGSLNTSRLLGVENSIGSIKEGKKANFVLINEDYAVQATYINGQKIYSNK